MSASPHYCTHCGALNEAESQLCSACGRAFDTEAELLHARYQLLAQVGTGGYGGVYRAIDTVQQGQVVAVKRINLRGLSAQESIEATDNFNREVRLLTDLSHPNLPAIRDTFTDQHSWYLVMDFIEGETLEAYLKRVSVTGLPLKETLAIGLQLCVVLDYLHTRQPPIIFRDLKPGNVMRTPDGELRLIDFGIARLFNPNKLKDTIPFGSPGYAAPEQYGRAQTTQRADIYSLGATLHFLLTGADPADNPFHFASLSTRNSPLLVDLDTLIQRMVAAEPLSRPRSVSAVRTTLQQLADRLEGKPRPAGLFAQTPPNAVPPRNPALRFTRRGLLQTAVVITSTAAVIGGVVTLCPLVLRLGTGVHGVAVRPPPSPGATSQQLIYKGHKGPITALSWSPDGTMVASGSADRTVQVWRAADGALLYTLSGYDQPVTSVVWATDRTNVIASSGMNDGTVQVWDALRDHRDLIFHGDGRALALSWQVQSPWIVSGGTDQEIYTWNATTGAKGASYTGHKGNVLALAWLQDSDSAASATASSNTPDAVNRNACIASAGADATVQVWLAATGQKMLIYKGHKAAVNALALLPPYRNLSRVASASDDGTVQVWEPDTGALELVYRGHRGKVYAVTTLSPVDFFGSLGISAGEDQIVQVWEPTSVGKHPLLIYRGHHAPIRAVSASPVAKDRRVVSGDDDGLVHLWTVTGFSYGSS